MSETPAPRRDLNEVLADAIEGTATADELTWLSDELRRDPQTRKQACRYLVDESLIAEEILPTRQVKGLIGALSGPHADKTRPRRTTPDSWLSFLFDHRGLAIAGMAAVLLVGLSLQHLSALREIDRLHSIAIVGAEQASRVQSGAATDLVDPAQATHTAKQIVGRVSGLDSVEWEDDATALRFGESIKQGRTVSLTSGVLELLLATGAKVTIEGPAKFEAGSTLETTLDHGKIAAAVPRAGRGFTIFTPTSEVVDLGTQFGVAVDDVGDTEVHVFEGDVVARSRLKDASTELVHAQRDEAIKFDSINGTPQRFAARTSDFVRRLGPAITADTLPPLPVTRELGVWYAADLITGASLNGPVSSWRDVLVGDNDFPDDAWQFEEGRCPLLVEDDSKHRALRFNGWSTYLVTAPMDTSDRQTAFVVYAAGPASFANDTHGGILLKYPYAPSLEVSVFGDHSTHGWVWPGPGAQDHQNVGVVRSKPVEQSGICVVAYTYDAIEGRSELWNNGVSQGTADAPIGFQQPGHRYVGRHPDLTLPAAFFGNIYEVLIYDTVFDEESMASMNGYFRQRYGISPGS